MLRRSQLIKNACSHSFFMILFRIEQEHPYLNTIQIWYEESFPADERRRFTDLRQLLPCPDMHLCGLVEQNQLIGFMIYWQWPETIFIEHFAVDPGQRGKQLGQRALSQLLTLDSAYFILEVELPLDDVSRRRIHFYERQGFHLNSFVYAQPPYQRGAPNIPMHLMSLPAIEHQETFTALSTLIKERVYERFY